MRRIRPWVIGVAALALVGLAYAMPVHANEPDPPWDEDGAIDVVICLDVSGSMKALIDSVRLKLWDIVNVLAQAEPTPRLRVALLTYGNRTGGTDGWVRLETGFTQDLDLVSERLDSLVSENGGMEYVGRVLRVALDDLEWTPSDRALKLIFLAGNESTDQDPQVSFREMSQIAHERGISVHAIFCGPEHPESMDTWRELAELAQGQFSTIDHLHSAVVVATPFDAELAALSAEVSRTSIPLGEAGQERQRNQASQDENAQKLGLAAAASRARTKISPLYSNEWDLVAVLQDDTVILAEIDESELPEPMRRMTAEERDDYVAGMTLRRAEIRRRITALSEQRTRYITEQIKVRGLDDSRTFDSIVRQALEQTIEEKGYQLPQR